MIHSLVHYFHSLVRRYTGVLSAIILLISMFLLISKHSCHFIQYIYIYIYIYLIKGKKIVV